jgi:cellulose synthase/poly-beta-1,6-N-acetylglucosamine synthase-like glycosyltransferase
MELLLRLVFFSGAFLLLYTYFLYPLVLIVLSPANDKKELIAAQDSAELPFVSVIVAAYNEEQVIRDRIVNFLASSYAGESELLIVSDASTDSTDEIVKSYANDRVRLLAMDKRQGKGAAINRAVPASRGEILVFTDASSAFAAETVEELVNAFADPAVGLVNGRIHYRDANVANLYHRYERLLKNIEVRKGIVASAHGAVYALRRSIWEDHDPRLVNDFYDPIVTILKGYTVAIAPKALCVESFSMDTQFRRQVRMVALAALVFFKLLPRIVRARCWRLLLVLTSHKLLRWLTAIWLLVVVAATMFLASAGSVFYVAAGLEVVAGLLATAGFISDTLGIGERTTVVYNFLVLNCAAIVGLWICLRGKATATWQPNAS